VDDLTNLNQIVSDHGGEKVEDLKEIGKKFASFITNGSLAKNADNLIAIFKNIKNAVKDDGHPRHHEVRTGSMYFMHPSTLN
jgi:hypothetical protein